MQNLMEMCVQLFNVMVKQTAYFFGSLSVCELFISSRYDLNIF